MEAVSSGKRSSTGARPAETTSQNRDMGHPIPGLGWFRIGRSAWWVVCGSEYGGGATGDSYGAADCLPWSAIRWQRYPLVWMWRHCWNMAATPPPGF